MFFPRRDPMWAEIRRMQEEMDSLMSDFWGFQSDIAPGIVHGPRQQLLEGKQKGDKGVQQLAPLIISPAIQSYRRPLMDLYETDHEIVSLIELPGVTKEDIKVSSTDDGVEIKVEKRAEEKEVDPKKGFYRMERSYSGFYRYVPMPKNADLSKLDASYKEGILELKVPKLDLKPEKREIKIN